MKMTAVLNSRFEALDQVEDLRLDGHVERGGRLVGDQQLGVAGEGHGDHHALAHTAGELVRVVVDALLGGRDADQLQQLDGARSRPARSVMFRCSCSDFADLAADGQHRVERGHRVLEDHGDLVAADMAHLVLVVVRAGSCP